MFAGFKVHKISRTADSLSQRYIHKAGMLTAYSTGVTAGNSTSTSNSEKSAQSLTLNSTGFKLIQYYPDES